MFPSSLLPYVKSIIGGFLVALFGIVFGLLIKGIDRKLAAHMQWRIGPPIRQPFRDVRKLLCKENVIPQNAITWLFNSAPIIALASSIAILLYLPIGPFKPILSGYGDLILVLYLLLIPSIAMIIGGLAAGSPFATVGAQREIVTLISYEFPLAFVIFSICWKYKSLYPTSKPFSPLTFLEHPIWNNLGILGLLGVMVLLFAILIVIPGELSKVPFDVPEAETEIAGGILVEYSGRNLALFYLADAVKAIAIATLVVTIFFPYNLSPLLMKYFALPLYVWYTIDFLFYLFKVFIILFFSMTFIRVSVARFKIDQVVRVYWLPLAMTCLAGLILLAIDGAVVF